MKKILTILGFIAISVGAIDVAFAQAVGNGSTQQPMTCASPGCTVNTPAPAPTCTPYSGGTNQAICVANINPTASPLPSCTPWGGTTSALCTADTKPTASPLATASPLPNGPTGTLCRAVGSAICKTPVYCDLLLTVSANTNATVAIASVSAGQVLYVCKWTAVATSATGTPYFQLEYSTGSSTCAGLTAATGAIPGPTGTPLTPYQEQQPETGAPLAASTPGTTLCWHNGGTTPSTTFTLWYTLF